MEISEIMEKSLIQFDEVHDQYYSFLTYFRHNQLFMAALNLYFHVG